MLEYEARGHMRLLTSFEIYNSDSSINYIPHHAIWPDADGKRKLRVVFNASDKSPSQVSLNQTLFSGPKLQNNLGNHTLEILSHRLLCGHRDDVPTDSR